MLVAKDNDHWRKVLLEAYRQRISGDEASRIVTALGAYGFLRAETWLAAFRDAVGFATRGMRRDWRGSELGILTYLVSEEPEDRKLTELLRSFMIQYFWDVEENREPRTMSVVGTATLKRAPQQVRELVTDERVRTQAPIMSAAILHVYGVWYSEQAPVKKSATAPATVV